ncbi:hypothetical protein [Romboutsia sp.]|uniref:hypothetical protein n=1 Tax=Romboutsia sp. TaxID=1965302 RepID=UPI003F34FEDB
MKDKYTYDLIEGISENENLELDFDNFFSEEELNSIDVDNNKIKNRTYEKIGDSKIKKYKNKKILNLVASIALILLIGTPVALAFVNQLYKYDKSSGSIIKSDVELYILDKPITKKIGNGEITINSFVVNPKDESVEIGQVAKNISGFEYKKGNLIVDDKNISNSTYDKAGSSWDSHTYIPFKYKNNKEFKYEIILMDIEKNTTKVSFDINLEKATSVEEYNKHLPKEVKNNIVLSTITREEENYLYAELMAIPNVENFNFRVDHYGNHINENKGSNIFLVDANGEKVEGEYFIDDNKYNEFKFDTSNLQKPYTIEIDKIQVSSTENEGKKINLPKLKFGESVDLNKMINIEDTNNIITKESHNVLIKKVSRKEVEGCDTYVLDVEYPDNKKAKIKIDSLNILSNISWFGFGKFDFSSSSQEKLGDGSSATICIYLSNRDDKNYKGKEKVKSVGFKMSGYSYTVGGPWKLKID